MAIDCHFLVLFEHLITKVACKQQPPVHNAHCIWALMVVVVHRCLTVRFFSHIAKSTANFMICQTMKLDVTTGLR